MRREPFFWIAISCGLVIMAFILLPLIQMMSSPSAEMLKESIQDRDVMRSIWLSIYTAGAAALISFFLGTPLAYLLARSDFRGKRLVESIIDLPIAIPHPVIGIAILSVAGKNYWIGQILSGLGIRIMGSVTGIITVLTFVGLPFYLNAAKTGFEAISPRLEKVSRSLGASMFSTFFRITFPLAWRSMLI
ncbi:MAG: ABC transporter permease, partial [Deltaproteobacteria bacterium]|nr:ABC transporter permease [Deltaproteobacteria bacterium]